MDTAVALVQAYLYANGYFTVTEYPVILEERDGVFGAVTDLDILAVRLPGAYRLVPKMRGKGTEPLYEVDPVLQPSDEHIDLLIGEVKEGKAELNRGARDHRVLRAVLPRFGAVAKQHSHEIVDELLQDGEALVPDGPRVRLVAFGSRVTPKRRRYAAITLGHIVDFMQSIADEHWDVFGHTQFKDPAIGFMMVLEKARRYAKEAGDDDNPARKQKRRRRRRPRRKPDS
ncbi:MAG: hypothetical protein ACYTGW_05425 [Planctomycetota bacterium]|jgi:hypothetical protein